jgi:tryptophan synthase alpha chain
LSNRIDLAFAAARERQSGALLPYLTAGYPDLATTADLLRQLDKLGVAAVELGIPFSDPIADGPVIQTSFTRALDNGVRVRQILDMLAAVREELSMGVLAMVSFSIVYRVGVSAFIERLARAGFDGLITPDLALEEAPGVADAVRNAGLHQVMMVAPTSSADRTERIAKLSSGFVYYQAVVGVTGERSSLPADMPDHIAGLRAVAQCPIAVGFGVSTPQHVRDVCAAADGAIVGSAIVRRIHKAVDERKPSSQIAADVASFVEELLGGTRP